ncbi:putative outer membrane protein A [hydrothermal vent metagenome]|uniref:Putative outer membrane protein A n=1 Tax=hydrothermal vent metagenome TaxID=652676 RepID=A0A1W1BTQ0_9ZZZZ
MKNIKLSIITLISIGTLGYAGGEFSTITPYENEDIELATEAVVEEPVIVKSVVVEPKSVATPLKVEQKEINPSGFYAGLGITGVRYDTSCNCPIGAGTDKNIALLGRVGYDFNRYIGIEVRGMKTIAEDDGADISHTGLFIKPMIPLMNYTNIYALIGAAKTSTKGKLQKISAEGLALGAGLEVDLSKDSAKDGKYSREFDGEGDQEKGIGLFIDYERLVVKDNAPDIDTVSAGVTYDF